MEEFIKQIIGCTLGAKNIMSMKSWARESPPRTLHNRYGKGGQSISWLQKNVDPSAKRVKNGIKHKYLYPLDRKLGKQLQKIALPYPKKPADD